MSKFRKSLLIGITVLSLGTASFAAQAFNGPDDTGAPSQNFRGKHRWNGEHRGEFFVKRQAELHSLLKLSAEQEPAWKAFTASATPPRMVNRPDRAGWEKLSAPERMEQRLAFMKKAEAAMETRLAAMKTFYAVLTPEQQKVFNETVGGGQRRGYRHQWR